MNKRKLDTPKTVKKIQGEQTIHRDFNPAKFNFLKVHHDELLGLFDPMKGTLEEIGPSQKIAGLSSNSHLVMMNVNPFSFGHSLLIPYGPSGLPQACTVKGLQVVLQFLKSLGPNWRMLYNSLGAFASVNHFHFHVYWSERSEPVEWSQTTQVSEKPRWSCWNAL